ncbi:MAG: hypothetical protein AAF085_12990 [Planctomycetota bacterium]
METRTLPTHSKKAISREYRRWWWAPIGFILLMLWIWLGDASVLIGFGSFALLMAAVIFFAGRAVNKWLPKEMKCPSCDESLQRESEGAGTMFHYDCKSCQIRWETNMNHEESS